MDMGSWVAVDASTDLENRALELSRIRELVAAGAEPPAGVRDPVRRSWQRCASAGFDLLHGAAPVLRSAEEAAARWQEHPLSIAEPLLHELLADVRSDDDQVVLACDADGSLLWIDGEPAVLDAAHEVHLEPGALWSEPAAGTNAMGTALAVEHPIQIFSAEHLAEPVHGWTCSAAPIHDPETGELLGVIDLSGEASTAHPHSLALITAAARMVESELRIHAESAKPTITSPLVWAPLEIEALGRNRAEVRSGSRCFELSRRHSEIVVLLALAGDGFETERLACELYGDYGVAVTVRAELSRLRRVLGERLPRGRPRIEGPVAADFIEQESLLARGEAGAALARYRGPLLPGSRVPLIVEARERLELRLRGAARQSGDPGLLAQWAQTPSGREDIEASRDLVRMLSDADPALAGAISRLRRLSRNGAATPPCDNQQR